MNLQAALDISHNSQVLVTGATGYVGGRLVPRLLEKGYRIRVLVRDPRRLEGRPWLEQVKVFQGDVTQPDTLAQALEGVDAAYYLIHSMGGSSNFKEKDLEAGRNFGAAARLAGVKRIIYLGGLGDPKADLSQHLRSRQQTGECLRESGVSVSEFRAAVIVGSGSLSFEMIRYLTERIPVMICPRWVFTRTQPISIHDVLDYLVDALQTPESTGKVIEIGGADILTYGQMMLGYAKDRGLRRWLLPVPVLTPQLSSYWVHWMTPIPASIARPLIEGLRNEVVVHTDTAQQLFPNIQPMSYQAAVHSALENLERGEVETLWSDALTSSQGDLPAVYFKQEQGMFIERREKLTQAAPEDVFRIFSGLGGQRGWLMLDSVWKLRGALDRLVGGVGMRRGRRHPDDLRVGDVVDFWRVEVLRPGQLLRLRAEMKVPGKAWLQFEANPRPDGSTNLVQTAYFASKGLLGLAYWYFLYPIHATIFGGMVRKIAERAESASIVPLQPDLHGS